MDGLNTCEMGGMIIQFDRQVCATPNLEANGDWSEVLLLEVLHLILQLWLHLSKPPGCVSSRN